MSYARPVSSQLLRLLARALCVTATWVLLTPCFFASPAASSLTTELSATKRVTTRDAENRAVESWISFTKLLPGEEVSYTVTCTNQGPEPAAEVVVNLPIPAEMVLLPITVIAEVDLTCSVDNGKTFDRFDQLRVVAPDGASRPAALEDVRFLRWKFTGPIAPGAVVKLNCHARLK